MILKDFKELVKDLPDDTEFIIKDMVKDMIWHPRVNYDVAIGNSEDFKRDYNLEIESINCIIIDI